MQAAGVVLAGGRSSRMGSPKAALPWYGSTLLRRTVDVVARGVGGPVLVVRAPGQPLPTLPADVRVHDDPTEGLGPMQGLAVGLRALDGVVDVAFCCSTDLPFLHPVFVRRVVAAMDADHDIQDATWDVVLPMAHGHRQPLAAAYRPGVVAQLDALLAGGRLKPAFLFDLVRVRRLDDAALLADGRLAAADPGLDSVRGVNEPTDYERALARPGPQVRVERFGVLAANGQRGPRTVRAATIAAAADASGLRLDRHVVAAVNGERVTRDGLQALVEGDTVTFVSADAGG